MHEGGRGGSDLEIKNNIPVLSGIHELLSHRYSVQSKHATMPGVQVFLPLATVTRALYWKKENTAKE